MADITFKGSPCHVSLLLPSTRHLTSCCENFNMDHDLATKLAGMIRLCVCLQVDISRFAHVKVAVVLDKDRRSIWWMISSQTPGCHNQSLSKVQDTTPPVLRCMTRVARSRATGEYSRMPRVHRCKGPNPFLAVASRNQPIVLAEVLSYHNIPLPGSLPSRGHLKGPSS